MDHRIVARALLSVLCTLQGLATLAIDLNRTHATNPKWVPHARFHVVWQTFSVALLAVIEVALIWLHGPYEAQRFLLASLLAAISPLAFLIALAARRRFGGALSDPNGIPPARIDLFGRVREVDLNLVAVVAALVSLLALLAVYGR